MNLWLRVKPFLNGGLSLHLLFAFSNLLPPPSKLLPIRSISLYSLNMVWANFSKRLDYELPIFSVDSFSHSFPFISEHLQHLIHPFIECRPPCTFPESRPQCPQCCIRDALQATLANFLLIVPFIIAAAIIVIYSLVVECCCKYPLCHFHFSVPSSYLQFQRWGC